MVSRSAVRACVLASLLAGCGGGGSSNGGGGTATPGSDGSVAIAIKDAPSDHIERFEVDVTSLNLVRDDGLLLAVLPGKTRLDLAQLVNASQLLTVTAVPRGTYTSLKISFDLSGADVRISGNASRAQLVDASGAPMNGVIARSIEMKGKPIVAEPGLARFVEIDFDLDASCTIDASANKVTLGPVLKAETEPATPVKTRLHGLLGDSSGGQGQGGTFTIELRPPAAPQGTGPQVRVTASSNTAVVVNGKPSNLQALLALPKGAPVAAFGQLSAGRDTLVADRLEAGDPKDVVDGLVVSRTVDGTLTVMGRGVDFPAGGTREAKWTVKAAGARIDIAGPGAPLAVNQPHESIGVGQRIDARGELSGDTLDASKGMVIVLETPVSGIARARATGGVLTVELLRVAGRPVSELDWKVGNVVSADPRAFSIAITTLDISTVDSGTPVSVRGHMAAWNAPSSAPDMNAKSVADRTHVTAVLQCDWSTPTKRPFAAVSPGGFTIDLSAAGRKQVDAGAATPQTLGSTDRPEALPPGAGQPAKYLIVQGEKVTEHSSAGDFNRDCQDRLDKTTAKARSINAIGRWDPAAKKMVPHQVTLNLE